MLPPTLLRLRKELREKKIFAGKGSAGSTDDSLESQSVSASGLPKPRPDLLIPSRPGLHPRNDERQIDLDQDAIFAATQYHKEYTFNATTVQNLKQYNDSSAYNLPASREKSLLRDEIKRLSDAARITGSFLFESDGLFSAALDDAYEEIARITDQVKVALGIVRLDNACVSLKYCPFNMQDTIGDYSGASRFLRGRFDTDSEQGHVHDSAPKSVGGSLRNAQLYHALVDYITATVARTLMRTAEGDYWSQQVLSCLASYAVKLKTLSTQLERFAHQSILDATDAIDVMQNEKKEKKDAILAITFKAKNDAKITSSNVDPLDTETDATCMYHEEQTFYNRRIWWLLMRAIQHILLPEKKHAKSNCFQVHNSVYCAGIDGPPTIMTCDRLGAISASAFRFDIDTIYTSLKLVLANAKEIRRMSQQNQRSATADSDTLIVCEWPNAFENASSKCSFYVSKADEIISIMVPLALSSAMTSVPLEGLISFAASCTTEDDPVKQFEGPPKDFHASFDVSTSAWRRKESELHSRGIKDDHDDVVTLAQSPLRRGIQPNANPLEFLEQNLEDSPERLETKCKAMARMDQYAKDKITMQRWVVSEDSIKVSCRPYVNIAVAFAAMIIVGAIIIPFTVRDRIAGVDPFNITLYSWLLSGFVLLVAKGRYVSEWPWHQFIHGHVICRSVEEVCEVTDIDPQHVLSYLLINEWKSILRTRGPYNGLFARKTADTDAAFSINRPLHISTILASGFIVLKILNITGSHLIFMDVREGRRDDINHMDRDNRIACVDLDQYDESRGNKGDDADAWYEGFRGINQHVRRLERQKLRVDRVLGVYVGDRSSYFG